jgi:ribosome biogenesis GTPase A
MVGYPNVGKSSTINVLLQDHRVAVSSTPGKTRHFQVRPQGQGLIVKIGGHLILRKSS